MIQKIQDIISSKSSRDVRIKQTVSGLVFLIFVFAIVFLLPWEKIWQVLKTTEFWKLSIGFGILFPISYLMALNYQIIAHTQNMKITVFQFFWINLSIGFYQLFIPATFFGSGLRLYQYSKYSKKPVQSLATITYFKVFNIFQVLLLSFGFLFFNNESLFKIGFVEIGILIIVILLILLLIPYFSELALKYIPTLLEKTNQKFIKFILTNLMKVLNAFADFRKLRFQYQFFIISIGLVVQILHILSYYFLAESIGIHLTLSQFGAMRVVLLLAANLPINITPGIGLREVSLVGLLVAMNVNSNSAIAMSVLLFARTVFFGLLGGGYELFHILRK